MTGSAEVTAGLPLSTLIGFTELALTQLVGQDAAAETLVSWAHSTEMVDPRPHLRGSELICTVGSTLLSPASCAQFVEAVYATASAGICLGLGEVHTKVPRALVVECRRLAVPLLSMSHGVPFVAINDVLADARVTARTDSSARNADLLARLLAELRAPAPVASILAIAGDALSGTLLLTRAETVTETEQASHLTWRGDGPAPDEELLAQISRIVDLAVHETLERDHRSRQRIGHLFELVSSGLADAAALLPELGAAGLRGERITISAWPAETATILVPQLSDALIADSPELTYVVHTAPEVAANLARDLGLICGYSSPVDTNQILRGIGEARAAFELAKRDGSVAGPESLTSLTGLLEQQPPGRLLPFIDQLITPLLAADARRGTRLLDTLRTFIDHDGSLQKTADARFLHVNTVRHRLATVRKIVGRNPLEHGDLVSLEIALWAYERGQRTNR